MSDLGTVLKSKIAEFGIVTALGGNPARAGGLPAAIEAESNGAGYPEAPPKTETDRDPGMGGAPMEALQSFSPEPVSSADKVRAALISASEPYNPPAVFSPMLLSQPLDCGSGGSIGLGCRDPFTAARIVEALSGVDDNALLIRKGLDGNEFKRIELPQRPQSSGPKGHEGGPT